MFKETSPNINMALPKFPSLKPRGLTRSQKKYWGLLLFLARLLMLSIPLYIVLSLPGLLLPLQSLVAHNSAHLLSLSLPAASQGTLITIQSPNGFQFLISGDCTGWKSMLFLFALIFAVPAVPLTRRLLGLLVGIPMIYLGNLLRILAIVLIQQSWGTPAAEIFHAWFWGPGLIALVLLVWGAWLWACKSRKSRPRPSI
jgi:exosortase/archaeosortase family protein